MLSLMRSYEMFTSPLTTIHTAHMQEGHWYSVLIWVKKYHAKVVDIKNVKWKTLWIKVTARFCFRYFQNTWSESISQSWYRMIPGRPSIWGGRQRSMIDLFHSGLWLFSFLLTVTLFIISFHELVNWNFQRTFDLDSLTSVAVYNFKRHSYPRL